MRNCQPFSQMSVVFLPKVAQHIVTISNDIFYCPFCMFIVYGSNVKYSPPVRNCETTLTFTGPPDVLCGTSKTSSCGYFCNNGKIFSLFFHSPKILFSLSTISNVETKAFSFLHRIPDPPSCFLFPMIFVGMRVVKHFSKMQIQRNRCENTRAGSSPSKILEKQPNFWCSRGELGLLLQHSSTMRAKNFPQKKFVRQAKILRRFQLQRGIHQKLESFTLVSSPLKKLISPFQFTPESIDVI